MIGRLYESFTRHRQVAPAAAPEGWPDSVRPPSPQGARVRVPLGDFAKITEIVCGEALVLDRLADLTDELGSPQAAAVALFGPGGAGD